MGDRSSWFKGTMLEGKVLEYLNTRRDNKLSHSWRHEKRSWMRLMTNATVDGKTPMEIDNHSGFWNRSGMYEETSGYMTARPSITSIDIKTTGTAGSMREATINFEVYSSIQLKTAQLSFFIPGISVIALWGWTIKQDGTPVNPKLKFTGATSVGDVYSKLIDWIKQNDGCTDGIMGVVSDFKWEKKPGGGADTKGYECQITVESVAKSFLQQASNPPTGRICGCPEGQQDDDREVAGGWVKQALHDQAESEMGQDSMRDELWKGGANKNIVMGASIKFDSDYNPVEED